jgi:hypothetical protein
MSWFQKALLGVDIDEEQRQQEELDRKLAESNRDLLNRGVWTQAQYDQAEQDRQAGAAGDLQGEVFDAARAGAIEGAESELGLVKNVTGAAADAVYGTVDFAGRTVFRAIPWWVFFVGAIALFFWAGGGVWLKGRLAR